LQVRVTNRSTGVSGFSIEGANFDPNNGYGTAIGANRERALDPGDSQVFRYYLPGELGILRIRDFANPFINAELGLYGALIVEPAGATWHDPATDSELDQGVEAVIRLPNGDYFREFVTLFADHDREIGMFLMPYDVSVDGDALVNFRTSPIGPRIERLGTRNLTRQAHLFTAAVAGPPSTPVFVAEAGDRVRFRVLSAHSEQPQVFSVEGHDWQMANGVAGADVMSSRMLISGGALNVALRQAGGPAQRPGDYLWLNHRMPFLEAGQWGILRIVPRRSERALGPRRERLLFSQQQL